MGWKAKNIEKHMVFIGFLHFWEARKRCLSILGAVLAVSEASGGLSWTISEHFWTCWREHGEQEGQDGDMMAPGWVMIVPRWGMIVARWAF